MMNEEQIFEQAIAIEETLERERFIAEACDHDPQQIEQIKKLLQLYFSRGLFLEQPALQPKKTSEETHSNTTVLSAHSLEKPGDRIGNYRLIRQIGEGGMAIVFEAKQTTPIKRDVAIKIIKPGLETKDFAARMEFERQALAMMNHASIASVYDAGMTENGRPFFVMELIEGLPITQYCDERKLGLPERIQLLIDACRAIEHAHRCGILHRDLKPGNILVTASEPATVKIIDFGIAKTFANEADFQKTLTQMGQVIGTPKYMSPEQASFGKLPLDTRADVYSLGAVLYELLTGKPPIEADSTTELLLKVSKAEIVPPSRLNRAVDRDLENICQRSLHKNPDRRYSSAREFSDDLRRYLQGMPVLARSIGPIEKTLKWSRRSPAVATLAAASIVGVLLLATVWASFTWELKKQRDENKRTADRLKIEKETANRNFEKAHQSIRSYLETIITHTPLGSTKDLAYQKQMFEIGSRFYDDLIPGDERYQRMDLEARKAVDSVRLERAKLHFEFSKVQETSFEYDQALDTSNFVEYEVEYLVSSPSEKVADAAAELMALMPIHVARTYYKIGDYSEATESALAGIQKLQELGKKNNNRFDWQLAIGWIRAGIAYRENNLTALALEAFDHAIRHADTLPILLAKYLFENCSTAADGKLFGIASTVNVSVTKYAAAALAHRIWCSRLL